MTSIVANMLQPMLLRITTSIDRFNITTQLHKSSRLALHGLYIISVRKSNHYMFYIFRLGKIRKYRIFLGSQISYMMERGGIFSMIPLVL